MSILKVTNQMCMKIMDDGVEVISFNLKFESLENMINSEFFWSKLNTI